jgi:penicillin-binding protein-related factor A (putative recombinase)
MNEGKIFEKSWKDSVPPDVYYLRIHDPPQSWGDSNKLRFSAKNPFDLLMYSYPYLFLLEMKSTKGTSFSFKGSSPMIKEHQIKSLTEADDYKGIVSGFIFNFRKQNSSKAYFLHIEDFNKLIKSINKSSINEKDIIENNAMEIIGEIKRTRYKYYIGEFIKRICEKEIS